MVGCRWRCHRTAHCVIIWAYRAQTMWLHNPKIYFLRCPVSLHATPFKERSRTSMMMDVSGGKTTVPSLLPVPAFLKVIPCLPKARLAGRDISLLSPTHIPLIDASHPIGRAVPALLLLLLAVLEGVITKYKFSSEGREPIVTKGMYDCIKKLYKILKHSYNALGWEYLEKRYFGLHLWSLRWCH